MLINAGLKVGLTIVEGLKVFSGKFIDKIKSLFDDASVDFNFADNLSLKDNVSGLTGLIDFTRSSIGTYVDAGGVIQTSKVNLMPYSEEFDNWIIGSNAVVTANTAIAPNGQMTADQLYFSATGNTYVKSAQNITLEIGKTYTVSMWAKAVNAGVNDEFIFYIDSTLPQRPIDFIITTSEWQRFEFTWTHTTVTASVPIFILNDDANIADLYVFGCQVEEAVSANDYIKTGTAANFAPRFDHDFETGESLGLLMEKSIQNKIKTSEDLDPNTTSWQTTDAGVVSTSAILAPDGVGFMQLVDLSAVAGSTSSGSRVYHPSLGFNSTDQAFSFYARSVSGTGTFPAGYYNGSNYTKVYVNLTEEIQRFTIIVPSSVSAGDIAGFTIRGQDQLQTLDKAYIWGCMFENNAAASSYIKTDGVSVTRAEDVASISGSNFSDWYNQSEGTFVTNTSSITNLQSSVNRGHFEISESGTSVSVFRHILLYRGTSQNFFITSRHTSANAFSPTAAGIPNYENDIVAYAYSSSEASDVFYEGSQITSTASTVDWTTYTSDTIYIGTTSGGGVLNGHLKRFSYFNTKLPDADLIEVTS